MEKKKVKVNLLTFNSALSYGAVLQTYALVKALEKLNCEVELIDFRAPFLPPMPTGWWTLKTYYNLNRLRKELLFKKFRKEFLSNKTKPFLSAKALKKHHFDADFYVVGSDQVWNPDITKKHVLQYFFDFVKGNKIAYAASFGKEEWNYADSFTEEVRKLLTDFNAISVRESQAVSLMKEKFEIRVEVVLDPTLLNPDFKSILPYYSPKEQIAAISVNNGESLKDYVIIAQKKMAIPAYSVDSQISGDNIIPVPFPDVKDWIRYIAESSFVITDSFHGVALSIIYKKNFIVVNANPKRFIRIQGLLETLGLENRIVESQSEINKYIELISPINYEQVELKLKKLREASLQFIKSSINLK